MSDKFKHMSIGNFDLVYELNKPIIFKHLALNNFKITDSSLQLNYFNVILKAYASNKLPKGVYTISEDASVERENIDDQEFLVLLYRSKKEIMNKIDVMVLQSIFDRFLSKIELFG